MRRGGASLLCPASDHHGRYRGRGARKVTWRWQSTGRTPGLTADPANQVSAGYPAGMARGGDPDATRAGVTSADSTPSVPTVDRLLHPVLEVLTDGQTRELSDVVDAVADTLGLSAENRELRTKSGSTVLENRVGWVRTSLVRAGLIDQPRASTAAITEAGRTALANAEEPIDGAYLRRECPGYANWIADMGGELPEDELTGRTRDRLDGPRGRGRAYSRNLRRTFGRRSSGGEIPETSATLTATRSSTASRHVSRDVTRRNGPRAPTRSTA